MKHLGVSCACVLRAKSTENSFPRLVLRSAHFMMNSRMLENNDNNPCLGVG